MNRTLGGACDHGVLRVTEATIDLIDDAVDIDPGSGPIKEFGLVLLLGDETGKLHARLFVTIARSVDLMQEFTSSAHQLSSVIGGAIQRDPDARGILGLVLAEAVCPEENLHPG